MTSSATNSQAPKAKLTSAHMCNHFSSFLRNSPCSWESIWPAAPSRDCQGMLLSLRTFLKCPPRGQRGPGSRQVHPCHDSDGGWGLSWPGSQGAPGAAPQKAWRNSKSWVFSDRGRDPWGSHCQAFLVEKLGSWSCPLSRYALARTPWRRPGRAGDRRPRGHPRCGQQSSGSSGQEGEAERQAATSVGLAMSP